MVALQIPDAVYQRLLEQANQRGVSVEQWLEQISHTGQTQQQTPDDTGDHRRAVLLYNLLLEHYPDGLIAMFDRDLRYTIANGEGLRHIGMSSADLEGRRLRDVFPPEIYQRDEPNLLAALAGEKRTAIVELNNEQFQVTTLPVRSEEGEVISGMVISRNITERKQNELLEAERAALAMELEQERALTQVRSKLLSIISHEFRTPLTIIMSSADLLSTYSDRLSAQKREEKLTSIIAQVRQLDRMLDEIGMLLHADRAFLNYRPVMTDLALFCQAVSAEAAAVVPSSHRLELNIAFTDPSILLDPDLMRHALMNLLSNAIKYSPHGGIIALGVQQTGSGYEFSVRDQGIGIPANEQARLFMPFERASNVGTIRGTGLGLSIVKEVAELHNGSIRLESEMGVGSVFTLIIPTK